MRSVKCILCLTQAGCLAYLFIMQTIGIFEAKNKLSEICGRVAQTGEPCIISRRGQPLVKLEPVFTAGQKKSVWDLREESERQRGPITDDFKLPKRTVNPNFSKSILD